ncbi:MAG TPA: hypothetical protein VFH48_06345 [Chloroflexota bacterium]|nr:hypothetical protein [Chloroflexota bacterium]
MSGLPPLFLWVASFLYLAVMAAHLYYWGMGLCGDEVPPGRTIALVGLLGLLLVAEPYAARPRLLTVARWTPVALLAARVVLYEGLHLLAAALLEAGNLAPDLSRPARHVFLGTFLFTVQAPLLLGWLGAWNDAPAWVSAGSSSERSTSSPFPSSWGCRTASAPGRCCPTARSLRPCCRPCRSGCCWG